MLFISIPPSVDQSHTYRIRDSRSRNNSISSSSRSAIQILMIYSYAVTVPALRRGYNGIKSAIVTPSAVAL